MVATVNNSPAAAAGRKPAEQPQQAPAARASALRLNNAAAGNDFAEMSRSLVVDESKLNVSPQEVKHLMNRYETLKPSKGAPETRVEMGNRLRVNAHLRESLRQLHEFSQTGKLSRSDFDRISKAVVQAKLEPSAASHRKAIYAIEDPINRDGLQVGETADHRNRLMQLLIDRGDFREDGDVPNWTSVKYSAEHSIYASPQGEFSRRHSNVEKAYSLLSTIDPNAVDRKEMRHIGDSLRDWLDRGNGFISDGELDHLKMLIDTAHAPQPIAKQS